MKTRYGSHSLVPAAIVAWVLITLPGAVWADEFAKVGTFGAQWERLARSPRSEALGGSDMAVASGPFAVLSNTAPLPKGDGVEAGYGRFEYRSYLTYDYLGGAFEYGPLRLGAVGARASMDPIVVRTAYNPEGTGETIDAAFRFIELNASCDISALTRAMLPSVRHLSWTAGLGYRHRTMELDESSADGWELAMGTSARLGKRLESGWVQITGSAHLRNFTDRTVTYGERKSYLPRVREFGLAAAYIRDLADRPGDELRIEAMYSGRKDLNYDGVGFFGHPRVGFELTLWKALALRAGSDDTRILERDTSYGFGLILPESWTGPILVTYDYARVFGHDYDDSQYGDRGLHALGLRAAY